MDWTVGRWRVRLLDRTADLSGGFALRDRTFRGGRDDGDAFDASARHLLLEDESGVQGYARVWAQDSAAMLAGYSAQFYDMAPVVARHPRAVEIGRVCLAGDEPDLPRLLLAALAHVVDRTGASLLYGCASFEADEEAALGALRDRVAQAGPGRRAAEIMEFPDRASGQLPLMLRLYLGFGAEVSDHAVRDRDLGTIHVLAMLPLAAIPPARARLLRALAPEASDS